VTSSSARQARNAVITAETYSLFLEVELGLRPELRRLDDTFPGHGEARAMMALGSDQVRRV
jgi:hypothetical protein